MQLAVAFSSGIFFAHYLSNSLRIALTAGAVCSVISMLLLLRKLHAFAGVALLIAFVCAGATLATLEIRTEDAREFKRLVDKELADKPLLLTGVLDGPPEFARDRVYLSLRVERFTFDGAEKIVSGRVSLLAPFRTSETEHVYRSLQLRYGTRLHVSTTLDRAGHYQNPGVSPLSEYLDRRGFDATGVIRSPASLARLEDTNVFQPLALLYDWRERLQRTIDSRFSPETAGVLDAALLGNRYNLSRAASERFREGGTFHVLVISGLHISFIGGVVFLVVRRLTKRRLVQFLLPATIVWAYSIAVGAEASVVRAALMFTFAGLAAIVFRQSTSLNALGAAALVLLIDSPKEIFDPSFQLTFLSVLAIVAIAWPLLLRLSAIGAWYPSRSNPLPPACSRSLKTFCEVLFWSERDWREELARSTHKYRLFKSRSAVWLDRYHLQRCLRYIFAAVVVSASVQVVLLPLMIVYFHRVSLASLVLNIVVSVLLATLVVVAMLALLLAPITTVMFDVANAINWTMVHSVDPFSNYSIAAIRLPEYSDAGMLLYVVYYVPLLLLAFALAHWRPLASSTERKCRLARLTRPLAAAQLVLLTVLITHPFSARSDGQLHVDFLDVGQGDSALVTMPDGTSLLVDGGGRPSFSTSATDAGRRIGETVVSEYLWWRGFGEIDYVLATHADADHIDGLNDVLKNFSVRGAFVGRRPSNDPEFAKFAQTLVQTGVPLETIEAGDSIHFGEVVVKILWPPGGPDQSTNNDSVVMRIEFGKHAILLTGDIEKRAEGYLIATQQPLRADVVKVPHHGSKTSSTEAFVLATKPSLAIISVGRNSMFGHPHREVVERWVEIGAKVLITGDSGTISVSTDGEVFYHKDSKTLIKEK